VPGQPVPSGATPSLLFGVGPAADTAAASALVEDTRTRLLSTRYHGHGDLAGVLDWRDSVVSPAYARGFALHLVLDDDSAAAAVDTAFGAGCGRPYPLSDDFLADVTQLAGTFGGTSDGPPLFVTVFDGVEAYACKPGAILADAPTTAYYRALLGRYLAVREIFHKLAPNALVGIGWHAIQASFDHPATGAGASMFTHFADAIRLSDFVGVSASSDKGNVDDVRTAVHALGGYAPVLLGYDAPAEAADQDLHAMLTEDFLRDATRDGLFAFVLGSDATTSEFIKDAIARFGRDAR
jgi:hypothetical protein